jgi:hypothetical protein
MKHTLNALHVVKQELEELEVTYFLISPSKLFKYLGSESVKPSDISFQLDFAVTYLFPVTAFLSLLFLRLTVVPSIQQRPCASSFIGLIRLYGSQPYAYLRMNSKHRLTLSVFLFKNTPHTQVQNKMIASTVRNVSIS